MSRVERKRLIGTATLGGLLTLLVLGAHLFGLLRPLERWLYDHRARRFQYFTPPPTDKLVHVDIDDRSLDVVGRWPWSRDKVAAVIRALDAAGAEAIGLDVFFSEAQPEHDAELAEAIRQAGDVLVPLSLTLKREPEPPLVRRMRDVLTESPGLDLEAVRERLQSEPDAPQQQQLDAFVTARRQAMYERADQLLREAPGATLEQARERLLPDTDPSLATAGTRVLSRQFRKARALRALDRHTLPAEAGPPEPLPASEHLPSIEPFGQAAANTGFVDYLESSGGVVRSVPLWVRYRGRLYPHMSLSLACMALDVRPTDVEVRSRRITIPLPEGDPIRLPTRSRYAPSHGRSYDLFYDIPWFGPEDGWTRMYDYPDYRQPAQHMSLVQVWDVIATRKRIRSNNRSLDEAIKHFYRWFSRDKLKAYEKDPPPLDDSERRAEIAESLRNDKKIAEYLKPMVADAEAGKELSEAERNFITEWRGLKLLAESNRQLQGELERQIAELRQKLEGKVALIGWTATGAAADFVSTSVHPNKAPGVVVHGTVFNSILTRASWHRAPGWAGWASVLLLGVLTTAAVGLLAPLWAAVAAVLLAGGWAAFNGLALFDYGNLLVPAGAPLAAVIAVWAGCTVWRYVDERTERARITSRFRSYVDPALVNYVLEHPEQTQLAGEKRELTVVFTDLAGFTTLSERLGTDTVPLLNRYMGYIVPLIRNRRGYVNKFLGDGIMFFYGAPWPNERHARDAVETVMDMQGAMERFNAELTAEELPNVKMRAGIASGPMVVGDAGPPDASDYTVLGDTVNLASRLEAANKITGTYTMMTGRTVELLEGLLLVRPLGSLQVVGKSEGVMVYEPLAYESEASDEQRELAEQTRRMVELYTAGRFMECLDAADRLDERFGASKLANLYRKTCRQYLVEPPAEFSGQLVLTEK